MFPLSVCNLCLHPSFFYLTHSQQSRRAQGEVDNMGKKSKGETLKEVKVGEPLLSLLHSCSLELREVSHFVLWQSSLSYNFLFSFQPWFLFCTFTFCPDTPTIPWKGRKKELFCDRPKTQKEKMKTPESICGVWITTSCSGTAGVVRSFLRSKVPQRSQNDRECVCPNMCWWAARGNVGASLFGFSCVCI